MRNYFSVRTAVVCGLLAAGLLVATTARRAEARPVYLGWWTAKYPDVAKKNEVAAKVKCNVCHFGTTKKNRNEYAKAIEKALEGKKNLKKGQKDDFDVAIKKAEDDKAKDTEKTFGELLKDNQLPIKGK